MAEVITNVASSLGELYTELIALLPTWMQQFVSLFVIVLVILIYSIFIWKFYRFISKKNIVGLNLSQYNRANHPVIEKIVAGIFYFIEYIIILPFLIFFWFAIFTLFLMLLTEGSDIRHILIISATVIAAIRMASYYKEELARDLAKMLPFTLLAVSIVNPQFGGSKIFSYISQLPGLFDSILVYLLFIIIIEVILRFFEFIFTLFGIADEKEMEKEEN